MLGMKKRLEVEKVLKREMTSAKGAFEAILGNGWMRYRVRTSDHAKTERVKTATLG